MQRQRVPTAFFLRAISHDLESAAVSSDAVSAIVDTSTLLGNEAVKFVKLTIGYHMDFTTDGHIILAITRETEDSAAPDLVSLSGLRNLKNEGHMIRGPFFLPTQLQGGKWKPKSAVLKNLTLDEDDDLRLCTTIHPSSLAMSSSRNKIIVFAKGYYRTVT